MAEKEIKRCAGYLGYPVIDVVIPTRSKWMVEFHDTVLPMVIPIDESLLKLARVPLEQGGIVIADINVNASQPDELNPCDFESGGVLPPLDETFDPGGLDA
jgi:hypothetical protein